MKLSDLIEGFMAVPVVGPDSGRPTPVAAVQHWGTMNAQLPQDFCKDRTWCERKPKKKSRKVRKIERRMKNATPRPY